MPVVFEHLLASLQRATEKRLRPLADGTLARFAIGYQQEAFYQHLTTDQPQLALIRLDEVPVPMPFPDEPLATWLVEEGLGADEGLEMHTAIPVRLPTRKKPWISCLALAALAALSCKKDEVERRRRIGEAELEVYKRGTEPTRASLSKAPPKWLDPASMPACPADVLPKTFAEPHFDPQRCAADRLESCLESCENSDAAACYGAAILLQNNDDEGAADISTPLYARACQLGDASGCTNWAAALDQQLPSNQECLSRTFESTCSLGQDPWGCTMYAFRIASQDSSRETLEKIRKMAETACKWGEDDPACQTIRNLIAELESDDAR